MPKMSEHANTIHVAEEITFFILDIAQNHAWKEFISWLMLDATYFKSIMTCI